MHSGSFFKYDKRLSSDTNADTDRRDDNDFRGNRNNLFEIRKLSQKHKTKGTTVFFSWLDRYRLHSDSIGKIMYESWGKPSIFACCKYKSGRLVKRSPEEPPTKDVGLARRHLMKGYPQTWQFYERERGGELNR